MTVNVSKPASNLREQLSELNRPVGSHGSQLMKSANTAESFSLVRAGRKNLIINGSCLINQYYTGSAATSGYPIDRTHFETSGGGTHTGLQVSDAPEGLFKSVRITVTGPDTSLGSTEFYSLRQIIEGNNVSHLGFGTNNAKTVTLSFWVKSSVPGLFCCSLGNGTNNKTMPKEYHIDNPNKWEYKTLTFAPAITGSWGTNENRGFSVRWCMGVGSSRQGSADVYNGNESHGTSKQTNLFATNGATFQITGMQLEEGNVATPFEMRSYAEELALCQRYYMRRQLLGCCSTGFSQGGGGYNSHLMNIPLPVKMRSNPTVTFDNGTQSGCFQPGGDTANFGSFSNGQDFVSVTTGSTNSTWTTQVVSNSSPYIKLSAEM